MSSVGITDFRRRVSQFDPPFYGFDITCERSMHEMNDISGRRSMMPGYQTISIQHIRTVLQTENQTMEACRRLRIATRFSDFPEAAEHNEIWLQEKLYEICFTITQENRTYEMRPVVMEEPTNGEVMRRQKALEHDTRRAKLEAKQAAKKEKCTTVQTGRALRLNDD